MFWNNSPIPLYLHLKQSIMTEKIIKVVGEGETIVTPDITRLGIRITKVFENMDEAYDENDKNYENMLSVIE